ncbi:transposase [Mesorhizobium sp. M0155]
MPESYEAGETVCAVARRYELSPRQLFTWRRLLAGRWGRQRYRNPRLGKRVGFMLKTSDSYAGAARFRAGAGCRR